MVAWATWATGCTVSLRDKSAPISDLRSNRRLRRKRPSHSSTNGAVGPHADLVAVLRPDQRPGCVRASHPETRRRGCPLWLAEHPCISSFSGCGPTPRVGTRPSRTVRRSRPTAGGIAIDSRRLRFDRQRCDIDLPVGASVRPARPGHYRNLASSLNKWRTFDLLFLRALSM